MKLQVVSGLNLEKFLLGLTGTEVVFWTVMILIDFFMFFYCVFCAKDEKFPSVY